MNPLQVNPIEIATRILTSYLNKDMNTSSTEAVISSFQKTGVAVGNNHDPYGTKTRNNNDPSHTHPIDGTTTTKQEQQGQKQQSQDNQQKSNNEVPCSLPPVNILCMDAGGSKGINLLHIYDALEESFAEHADYTGDGRRRRRRREPLANVFDLLAGASAGGVGAMAIQQFPQYGQASKAGRDILEPIINESFRPQGLSHILQTGHYYNDTRSKVFKEILGTDTPLMQKMKTEYRNDDANMPKEATKTAKPLGPKVFALAARGAIFSSSSPSSSTSLSANLSPLEPYLLRTYEKPKGHSGLEPVDGTSSIKLWEAAEATSAVPGIWGRTRAKRESIQREINLMDGGLIAVNPTRYALQEAALLFPGRPLGLVLSIGMGRFANDGPDKFSDDIADQVKRAGGQYVRLDPIVDNMVSILSTDKLLLKQMEEDVVHYMKTSDASRRAKILLGKCLEINPAIRGRYIPGSVQTLRVDTGDRKNDRYDAKNVLRAAVTNLRRKSFVVAASSVSAAAITYGANTFDKNFGIRSWKEIFKVLTSTICMIICAAIFRTITLH